MAQVAAEPADPTAVPPPEATSSATPPVATQAPAPAPGAAPAAAAPAASGGLEDIVVTARRTSESLQNVPVAVTAISGSFLDRQNVRDASTLPQLAPALTIAAGPGSASSASVYVRGIGTADTSAVSEQGVGIYLDGIYLARSAGSLFDVVDLERVEVLRGPQGTTFGRNTIGGAIQLVSRRPSEEYHVEAKGGFGRYNEWFVRSRVDTGYIGNTHIRAFISGQHRQSNGYVDNLLARKRDDPGSSNAESLLVGLQGDFGPLTVNYNFDYNDRRGTPAFFQVVAAAPRLTSYYGQSAALGGSPFVVSTDRQQDVFVRPYTTSSGDQRLDSRTKQSGHALTLAYEVIPELTLKSITGYRRFSQNTVTSLAGNDAMLGRVIDFTSPTLLSVKAVTPYTGRNAPQKQHQFSQEFQALGTAGDFSYLAGLYYFHERANENNQQALTVVTPLAGLSALSPALAPLVPAIIALNPSLGLTRASLVGFNVTPLQAFEGTATSKAVFGQVGWKPSFLDQKLEITGGIRYTKDRKGITLSGDVNPAQSGVTTFDNVSWLGSAAYQFNRDVLGYVRVSTGYRSGGIDARLNFINTFSPEKVITYEAGFKSQLFDRKLRFNVAAYTTNYTDLQLKQFIAGAGGASAITVNAGKVTIKGIEAETTFAPGGGLVFDGSIGFTDVDYKEFFYRNPSSGVISNVADIARPAYTPKWTIHVGGEYSHQFDAGLARLRVDYAHRSTVYYNALDIVSLYNTLIRSKPDDNLKARLSFEDVDVGGTKMSFGVFGDNLTNQKNINYGIDFGSLGFAGATFKRPLTYGVDAQMKF